MSRNVLRISATKKVIFQRPNVPLAKRSRYPIYPEISREAQRYVVNAIAEFFS